MATPASGSVTAFVRRHIEPVVRAAGYQPAGRWRWIYADGVVRVVDVQIERTRAATRFTLNTYVDVEGFQAWWWGVEDGAGIVLLSARVGSWWDPPWDVWWNLDRDGQLTEQPLFGPQRPVELDAVGRLLEGRVLPDLAGFATAADVLACAERTRDPAPLQLVPRPQPAGIRAAMAWRQAGKPMLAMRVEPTSRPSGVTVEFPEPLATDRPELAEAALDWATPFDDQHRVRRVDRLAPAVFGLVGSGLNADALSAGYSRFVSIRVFDPQPPDLAPQRLGDRYDAALAVSGLVDVELRDDLGVVLVSFADVIAHERPDLVDLAAARCAGFTGVTVVDHPDREVLQVRPTTIDRGRLRTDLRRWLRQELKHEL